METIRILDALLYPILALGVFLVASVIYNAFCGPLARFPGPTLNKLSSIPYLWYMARGHDHDYVFALHQKYGEVVRLRPKVLSFAGNTTSSDIYGFGKQKPLKDPLFYRSELFNTTGVDNIVTAEPANHGRQRRILSHAFSDAALREQEPMLKEWAQKMKGKMAMRSTSGVVVDMLKLYNCTTFDIMANLCFGEDLNMLEDGEYVPFVRNVFESIKTGVILIALEAFAIGRLLVRVALRTEQAQALKWAQFNFSKARVDRRMERTDVEKPDLWSRILSKERKEEALTRDEQYVNSNLFMIAGTETTATALSGLTYFLCKYPATLAKLTAELRENLSSLDDMTLQSLGRLKYMNACLSEAFRMYPPVPIAMPRVTQAPSTLIGGYEVPCGTSVGHHQFASNMSEAHFRNPKAFVPERWLKEDPKYANDHLEAVQPFSVGPRNCLGKNLAWHEFRLLCATTFLHFDVELDEKSNDWINQRVYFVWEKKPLLCRLRPVVV